MSGRVRSNEAEPNVFFSAAQNRLMPVEFKTKVSAPRDETCRTILSRRFKTQWRGGQYLHRIRFGGDQTGAGSKAQKGNINF